MGEAQKLMLGIEQKADHLRAPGAQAARGAIRHIAQPRGGRTHRFACRCRDSRITCQGARHRRHGKARFLRQGAQGRLVTLDIVAHRPVSSLGCIVCHSDQVFKRFNSQICNEYFSALQNIPVFIAAYAKRRDIETYNLGLTRPQFITFQLSQAR